MTPGDLTQLVASDPVPVTHAAGALLVVSGLLLLARPGPTRGDMLRAGLVAANPLALQAYWAGAADALLFLALAAIAAGVFRLAGRDYRAPVALGLVLAAAPLVSVAVFAYLPAAALFATAVLLLRRPTGDYFGNAIVIVAPLGMGLVSLFYLNALLGDGGMPALQEALSLFDWRAMDLSLATAAFVVGAAAAARSFFAAATAFVAGGLATVVADGLYLHPVV